MRGVCVWRRTDDVENGLEFVGWVEVEGMDDVEVGVGVGNAPSRVSI